MKDIGNVINCDIVSYLVVISHFKCTLPPLITLNKSKPYKPELPKVTKNPQDKKCYTQLSNKRIGSVNFLSFFNITAVLIKELGKDNTNSTYKHLPDTNNSVILTSF